MIKHGINYIGLGVNICLVQVYMDIEYGVGMGVGFV